MHSDHIEMGTSAPEAAPVRRPYIKPEFRHESVFETMALACGKIGPTSDNCMAQSSAS